MSETPAQRRELRGHRETTAPSTPRAPSESVLGRRGPVHRASPGPPPPGRPPAAATRQGSPPGSPVPPPHRLRRTAREPAAEPVRLPRRVLRAARMPGHRPAQVAQPPYGAPVTRRHPTASGYGAPGYGQPGYGRPGQGGLATARLATAAAGYGSAGRPGYAAGSTLAAAAAPSPCWSSRDSHHCSAAAASPP